jgi:chromate transporter
MSEQQYGPVRLYWPNMGSFNGIAALLSVLATMLIFRLKRNVVTTLAVTSLAELVLGWAAA